jgi:hypothetical protein
MGKQLVAFVHAIFRQRELLEYAEERDGQALSIIQKHSPEREPGQRRGWTRQDKRLHESSDGGGTGHPRAERLLKRFLPEYKEGPHAPLLRAAIDEARREGTVAVLVPALEGLADAHEHFLYHVRETIQEVKPAEMQFPWYNVEEPYREAGERILRFLPPECVRSSDCYWDSRYSTFESPVVCGDSTRGQRVSGEKVEESETFFIRQVQVFVGQLESETEFYRRGVDTLAEARARVEFLKHEIEHCGGHRLFYVKGQPIHRESDLDILYRLTWFATPSDFSSEVNDGRGPVDFKVSRGSKDKSLVEFKLAKNSKLERNLRNQVAIYEKASRTAKSLKVIFYFTAEEKVKVQRILERLGMEQDDSIILVDARDDNKPSASNA